MKCKDIYRLHGNNVLSKNVQKNCQKVKKHINSHTVSLKKKKEEKKKVNSACILFSLGKVHYREFKSFLKSLCSLGK